jgi:hypothetical protein
MVFKLPFPASAADSLCLYIDPKFSLIGKTKLENLCSDIHCTSTVFGLKYKVQNIKKLKEMKYAKGYNLMCFALRSEGRNV